MFVSVWGTPLGAWECGQYSDKKGQDLRSGLGVTVSRIDGLIRVPILQSCLVLSYSKLVVLGCYGTVCLAQCALHTGERLNERKMRGTVCQLQAPAEKSTDDGDGRRPVGTHGVNLLDGGPIITVGRRGRRVASIYIPL